MSTISDFLKGHPAVKGIGSNQVKAENLIDFSKKSVLAADVVQAIRVPANALVTKVALYTITAEGATCTVTVGDGDGANSWDASANLNSVGGYYSAAGTDAYAQGKFYTADDTIDLVMGHDTDTAKVLVVAEMSILDADLA